MAKKKENKQEPIIHIHAKCKCFEIFEHVIESKSVARLIQIRDYVQLYKDKSMFDDKDTLVVNTVKVNPTLFP